MSKSFENPLVFIVGCPRSGTTWLGRIFQQHPSVLYHAESGILDTLTRAFWKHLWAHAPVIEPSLRATLRERWLDLLEAVLLPRKEPWWAEWREHLLVYFGDDRQALVLHHAGLRRKATGAAEQKSTAVSYPTLRRFIDEAERGEPGTHEEKKRRVAHAILGHMLRELDGTPRHMLVEKTPRHLFSADFIFRCFPQAKMIEILRDGRDVCVSMDSYKSYMPQERDFQIVLWKTYAEKSLELRRSEAYRDRLLTVRYEHLKQDPAAEIGKILGFAGLGTSARQAEEIAAATHISKVEDAGEGRHVRKGAVGDWRARLSAEDLEMFRAEAGEVFTRLGYEWGAGREDELTGARSI